MSLPFIILFLPLIAALVILLGTRKNGQLSAAISVGSVLITLAGSIALLCGLGSEASLTWMSVGDLKLNIGIDIDPKMRSMMFIVTFIGALVHIFSLQYMKDDDAKARFFGGLSLFMFSMTGIVMADNFAMMFIFWELVGVSSYLLIGHWYQKDSAADAAKKAFLMNRIGDFGFMIGIVILFGVVGSLSFDDIAKFDFEGKQGLVTLATLCIFCGAMGKSAQFPLHTWLPDAMEGPTPVSALIHAATMVAAGVYMLVKVNFLIFLSPPAAQVIGYIGCFTALIAALIATQQDDIKKVLAYSTLSQLGYMVMAIGFIGRGEFTNLGTNAYDPGNAAYFHLYTHAFFKALLFLGSGAVIYACHHQQNIWKMGGLNKKMPVTTATFAIGTAALLGIVGFSGFFSKDSVLASVYSDKLVFSVAVFTVLLTAFYMTRLVVVAFLGEPKSEDAEHAKEVPPVMLVPLVLLALFSVIAGYSFISGGIFGFDTHHIPHPHGLLIPILASLMGLVGIGLGFVLYNGKKEDPINIPLLANKFNLDEIYAGVVRIFQDTLAYLAKAIDQIFIDGLLVRGLAAVTAGTGSMLRRLQVGNLQGYAFLFGLGVIAIIYFLITSL